MFNVDEMGAQDFCDKREKTLIVPISYDSTWAPYPVIRDGKRTSVIACISPTGVCPNVLFVVKRATVDYELYDHIPIQNVKIVQNESGFVNREAFLVWLKDCFLPYLHTLRFQYSYDGNAVLIMDNLDAHVYAVQSINLIEEKLIIHFLPAHSTDEDQPLDLGIFRGMKRFESNYRNDPKLSQQTNEIRKIYQSLYKMATPDNCRAAFSCIGIVGKIEFFINHLNALVMMQLAYLDITQCSGIRCYSISHIEELVSQNRPISPNQSLIYQYHASLEKRSRKRMKIRQCKNMH